jgi:hypothetical protein
VVVVARDLGSVPVVTDFGAGVVGRVAEESNDKYWAMVGGPWVARYRRSGMAAAIGIGRDVTHHFEDPHEALAFFDTLGPQYRRNRVLRHSCLVTYKDMKDGAGGWDAVEPFAVDAQKKLEITIKEIEAREGRDHGGEESSRPGIASGIRGLMQRGGVKR